MPAINPSNPFGAALRWIFPANSATLPYTDDASGIAVVAGAHAAINNSQPLLGPLSARPSAGGQTAAGGFRSAAIPAGLTYPITLAIKYVISQSPAGTEPIFNISRWSAKTATINFATGPSRFQAVVRNVGAIQAIDGPALGSFAGVQNLALVVGSPTERAFYINGVMYTDTSGVTVDYTDGAIYQRIGVGAAFDDAGDVIGSGSGNSAWAAIFEAEFTAEQLTAYFADPAQVFMAPGPVVGGAVNLGGLGVGGGISMLPPSTVGGPVQLGGLGVGGSLGTAPGLVRTLPFTRNPGAGARPVNLPNNSIAVLSDDAALAHIISAGGLLMGSDGRVSLASGALPAAATWVVVVTREADGKLGVNRYQVQAG